MPRNPSTGVYSKPAGTTPSVGQLIDPVPWNALTTDLGNEITNSLPRDGSAPMVAPIKAADGSVAAPGVGFASNPSTGIYLKSAGVGALAASGVEIANWAAAGLSVAAGTGAFTWASLGTAFTKGVTGYFKLPDGHIVQYGTGTNPGADHSVTLPIAFPTAFRAVIVVANGVTLSGLPNNTLAFAADVSTLSVFNVRPRFVNNSGSVGVATQSYYWAAIGY